MNKNGTEQNKAEIVQPPVGAYMIPYGHSPQEDEIRLIDYLRVLFKRKSIIIISGLTAIATIGAVFYALSLTPVYKAEAVFLPPTATDIQPLNIQGIHGVDSNAVYSMFNLNLHAITPRRTVFEKMNLLSRFAPKGDQDANTGAIFDDFYRSLTVTTPNTKNGDGTFPTVTLSMEGGDPVLIAEIVNSVTEEAELAAKSELISDIQAKVSTRTRDLNQEIQQLRKKVRKQRLDNIKRLETADNLERKIIADTITTLRHAAKQKRLDDLVALKEATIIAKELGIKNPFDYKLKMISNTNLNIITDIISTSKETYAHGYKALDAEIAALETRKTDDPFIPQLRGLQDRLKSLEYNRTIEQLKSRQSDDPYINALRDKEGQIARLESIHIDPLTVRTARLDQAAYPSNHRIKPNRRRIVMLGFVLGLTLGIFGAFFGNFLENERKKIEEL